MQPSSTARSSPDPALRISTKKTGLSEERIRELIPSPTGKRPTASGLDGPASCTLGHFLQDERPVLKALKANHAARTLTPEPPPKSRERPLSPRELHDGARYSAARGTPSSTTRIPPPSMLPPLRHSCPSGAPHRSRVLSLAHASPTFVATAVIDDELADPASASSHPASATSKRRARRVSFDLVLK